MARYREIADDMRRRIRDGEWPLNHAIPSIAQLQNEYDVPGLNTIRDAQKLLIAEGVLRAEQGVGVFVVALPAPPAAPPVEAALRAELDLITRAVSRAGALLEEHEQATQPARDTGEAAPAVAGGTTGVDVGVMPQRAWSWGWSTRYSCPECDSESAVTRGWIEPDGPSEYDPVDSFCQDRGHQVLTTYGPDPDADQAAAVAVEQWWERHAHAERAAQLLAAGDLADPEDLAAARWHARQATDLATAMPDKTTYRVHITTTPPQAA